MKFAYLIMAHNEFSILEKLLDLLDDERNDIYLHIDKKAKNVPANILDGSILKKSGFKRIDSRDIKWGGSRQVICEMDLLFDALKSDTHYDYYHLISGVDLPLHSQDDIHLFFEKNKGKEFIGKNDKWGNEKIIRYRYQVYHFFQDMVGRDKSSPIYYLNKVIAHCQVPFIHRQKKQMSGGAAWFSITDDFANYLYSRREWIKKSFKYTLCGDEHMIHSALVQSPYVNNQYASESSIYEQCVRYVDFCEDGGDIAGSPKSLEINDVVDLLGDNKYMFARKFDTTTEKRKKAVEYIYGALKK